MKTLGRIGLYFVRADTVPQQSIGVKEFFKVKDNMVELLLGLDSNFSLCTPLKYKQGCFWPALNLCTRDIVYARSPSVLLYIKGYTNKNLRESSAVLYIPVGMSPHSCGDCEILWSPLAPGTLSTVLRGTDALTQLDSLIPSVSGAKVSRASFYNKMSDLLSV